MRTAVALTLLLFGLPLPATGPVQEADAAAAPPLVETCGDRPLHAPIHIREDTGPEGFALAHDPITGEPIQRPGTGVTRGAGTADDPYVIEGWCLVGTPTTFTSSFWGIALVHTSAHVIVRDNVVLAFDRGIFLFGAANVAVEENDAQGSWANVIVEGSDDIVLRGNHVTGGTIGLVVADSRRALVAENIVHGTAVGAGIVLRALDSEARGNEISGIPSSADGAIVVGGERNAVVGNHIHDNEAPGIFFDSASDAVAEDNLVVRNGDGIASHRTRDAAIRHNTIADNARHGIMLDWWMGSQDVSHNEVRTNGGSGIHASEYPFSPPGTFLARGNDLVGHGDAGLDATWSDVAVDARHNWWGCPDGPTHASCDGILGAHVTYDPWLTEPNEDAGVRT